MKANYVIDEKGKRLAVQIPIKKWEDLQTRLHKLELFQKPEKLSIRAKPKKENITERKKR